MLSQILRWFLLPKSHGNPRACAESRMFGIHIDLCFTISSVHLLESLKIPTRAFFQLPTVSLRVHVCNTGLLHQVCSACHPQNAVSKAFRVIYSEYQLLTSGASFFNRLCSCLHPIAWSVQSPTILGKKIWMLLSDLQLWIFCKHWSSKSMSFTQPH